MKKYKYIDLFCGAGGMSLGFENANFENVFSIEYNEDIAKTYQHNFPKHKLMVEDIKEVSDEKIKKLVGNNAIDVIVGGPPCQGFSIAGNIARNFIEDERNQLFKEFVRFVKNIKPKMFVMENVAALEKHNNGQTIQEILQEFREIGYDVKYEVLNAVNYGIPQERRRIFIVGSSKKNQFRFPNPENEMVTVRQALQGLPKLENGEKSNIPNHNAMKHSEQMLRKMSYVKDGGDRRDIPKEIRPKSGDNRKYIRYNSDKPSVCITGDMRKVFHYEQNRALTPRELARIQTFPDTFIFTGSAGNIQQQIGNAVPPLLAFKIANSLREVLDNE